MMDENGVELRQGKPEDAGVSPERIALIKERAQGWVDDGHQPCIVLLAARRGVIFLQEAYGNLGPEADSPPIRLDTIYPVASLAKPFTAAVAMTLVEEGLLGLNRPVTDYIPMFDGEGREKILIRNLLTHSSGLRSVDVYEVAKSEHQDLDEVAVQIWLLENLDEWIAIASRTQPYVPPDSVMMYADINYELLAEVIKRVSNMDMDQIAKERIFLPLGMEDSHYIIPDELNDRIVRRPASAPLYQFEDVLRKSPNGNGGLYTTILDAAIFGQMLLNQGTYNGIRILSPASVSAMTKNQIPGMKARINEKEFPNASWGIGWSLNAPFKGPIYGEQMLSTSAYQHGGAGGVIFWADPTLEIIGAYFSVILTEEQNLYKGFADLFLNMVMAAIVEI
jgi:CubicO group peptidase (beta-lactamase class C family)